MDRTVRQLFEWAAQAQFDDPAAFGAALYEKAAGRPPRPEWDPQPPSDFQPDLPGPVERLILRSLRADPARRFQTVADLKAALADARAEIEESERRPNAGKKWPYFAVPAVGVTLGLMAYLYFSRPHPPELTGFTPTQAEPAAAASTRPVPDLAPLLNAGAVPLPATAVWSGGFLWLLVRDGDCADLWRFPVDPASGAVKGRPQRISMGACLTAFRAAADGNVTLWNSGGIRSAKVQ